MIRLFDQNYDQWKINDWIIVEDDFFSSGHDFAELECYQITKKNNDYFYFTDIYNDKLTEVKLHKNYLWRLTSPQQLIIIGEQNHDGDNVGISN